jgi:trans-aconitate 2-methyltransferase
VPHDWDATSYDQLPIPMTGWGLAVLDRLKLRGDETVLDAGCGTGRVTEALRERLPQGHVIALDASPSMLAQARERLGDDRVSCLPHDLLEPLPIDPVDAILSTATFHWVPDHDQLFANLAAVLAPGGPLVAQCGGSGNIANVTGALEALGIPSGNRVFATPDATRERLERAGFTDIKCWLVEETTPLPSDEFERYLATVCLGGILAETPEADRSGLVHTVAETMGEPRIDYVRLNIDAHRAD